MSSTNTIQVLDELSDYKNQLMGDLVGNSNIVSLVASAEHTTPSSLIYTQIFPYEHIPETADEAQTFICFDVDVQKSYTGTYHEPAIYIWIFTHRSLMRLPQGGIRVDEIAKEIANTIGGSRMYGLGELDLYSLKRFVPVSEYHGKVMTYYTTDFNRTSGVKKSVPSNRKTG